jgi:hypothetical protein
MKKIPRGFISLAIALYFAFQLVLVVRTQVLEDDRWGWAMFHHVVWYEVEHHWLDADGEEHRHVPSEDQLQRAGKSRLFPGPARPIWFGLGALRSIVDAHGSWMWETQSDPAAVAFRTTIRYRVNRGPETTEVRQWPAEAP